MAVCILTFLCVQVSFCSDRRLIKLTVVLLAASRNGHMFQSIVLLGDGVLGSGPRHLHLEAYDSGHQNKSQIQVQPFGPDH